MVSFENIQKFNPFGFKNHTTNYKLHHFTEMNLSSMVVQTGVWYRVMALRPNIGLLRVCVWFLGKCEIMLFLKYIIFCRWGAIISMGDHYFHYSSFRLLHIEVASNAWHVQTMNLFSSIKVVLFWEQVYWSVLLRVQLTFSHHWFRKWLNAEYSISHEIYTRFCCALLCCGYAIVHNEFTWSIYPYSSGLRCWHWGNR